MSLDPLPFARPSFLYLLLVVLVLAVLAIVAGRRRRAALGRIGRPETVSGLSSLRPGSRRRARLLLFVGLVALAAAVAGPRWGKGGETGVVVGRDLVVILDLSRSMTAADMADPVHQERWQAARAGLHDLVTRVQQRGGHRLALVVFAARPWVVCPLTSDYDHFLARLDEFSPKAPPPEVRPDPDEPIATGTAIGAAIRLALAAHDPRFPGYQDVLLVSDGDGPGVETESEGGVKDAADRQIPVHVVGVGDPVHATELVLNGGESVEFTKLQEAVLKDVARRTRGEYLSAGRDVPTLGDWFGRAIEPRPSRELADDAVPQPKDRSVWFLGAGLLFLLLAWVREP
jgi:Ca-activated chloride channel family protein